MRRLESFIITAAILAIPLTSYGWTKTYGGTERDRGRWIQQADDNGFILTGGTESFSVGQHDIWLIKTDSKGNVVWKKTYGNEADNWGYVIIQMDDGRYTLLGAKPWCWLMRLNSLGDTLWTKEYAGEDTLYCYALCETSDGKYVLTGNKSSSTDILLLTVNALGDTLWSRTYDVGGYGKSVQETEDGGYIVGGTMYQGDICLLKVDATGDIIWANSYGDSLLQRCYSVQKIRDGNFMVVGLTYTPDGGWSDLFLLKLDSRGDTVWTRIYGDVGNDWGWSISETDDGNYMIVGKTSGDLWLLKVDESGDTLWTRRYGGDGDDYGRSVQQTKDGGYIVLGDTDSWGEGKFDFWLLKTNEYGDTVWYEGSPREILNPQEGDTISYMIPAAWFKNTGTYPISDFYCHCEIWPWSGDSAACAYLSPPYHVKYWVSYEVEPGDSVLVKFSEWYSDDSSKYRARFYTTKESEPIWQTREKSVTFYGEPHVGVIEDQPESSPPSWELITSCGREIILQYSGYPQGFQASVFDVAGRQVDELETSGSSGLITWGEGCVVGVYFIRASGSQAKEVKRFIIMR